MNIVSGYAAGVDMAAHRAALECGGTTVLVLCEGILNFNIKKEFKHIWDWERIAVVSEFLPGIPWSVRNAMQRNKTICALSRAMILIESGTKGGSIEAGRASLEMGVPLFAPVYEGIPDSAIGNQELLKKGARPGLKNRSTHRANMKDVFSFVLNSDILKPDISELYPKSIVLLPNSCFLNEIGTIIERSKVNPTLLALPKAFTIASPNIPGNLTGSLQTKGKTALENKEELL